MKFFKKFLSKNTEKSNSHISLKKENDVWKELYDYIMDNADKVHKLGGGRLYLKTKTGRISMDKTCGYNNNTVINMRYHNEVSSIMDDYEVITQYYDSDALHTLYSKLERELELKIKKEKVDKENNLKDKIIKGIK